MSLHNKVYQEGYIKWLRSHIGHELIYLVYTTALVFDERGYLLVQERADFDWLSVPGGILELGENVADCIQREVAEETGIDCTIERFIGVFSHPQYNLLYPNGDQVQPWTVAFVCRAQHDSIQVDGRETLEASFRPVDEIRQCLPLQYQDMLRAAENHPSHAAIETVYAENRQPHYPILREKVGAVQIILSGGTAVVYNEDGLVLAIHDKHLDLWDFPSGLADLGESSSATIVREVYEEAGFEVEPVKILGIYSDPHYSQTQFANGDLAQVIDLLMECKIVGGVAKPDGVETDSVQFMPLSQLASQANLSPLRQQMFADLLTQQETPFIR